MALEEEDTNGWDKYTYAQWLRAFGLEMPIERTTKVVLKRLLFHLKRERQRVGGMTFCACLILFRAVLLRLAFSGSSIDYVTRIFKS